jgi:O-antigen/teichoic acid export membrane protein
LLSNQLSHIFSIKLILSGVYLLVTLFAAVVLNYSGHQLYLLLLICFNQVLASLIAYLRSNISALHHFKVDSMLSIMDKALMLIVCGALLYIPSLHSDFIIDWFVYAQLGAYALTLITAFVYVLSISGKISLSFSFSFSKDLLKKTFPFALLIGLMMIYAKIDGVMIQKLLPLDGHREAGLYASAFRLLDALNQFGYLFAVLLLPIFSRMLARNQPVESLVKTSFTTVFIVSVIASLGLSFYSKPLMQLLYHEDPVYAAHILQWLIFCFTGTCTVYIFGTLLTANGNLYLLSGISAIAVTVNFLLNLVLIPRLKAVGAAETAVITQLLIALLNFFVAAKIFRWKINIPLLARLALFATGCAFIFWGSLQISYSWIITSIVATFISALFAFMIGLLNVRSIVALIRTS